MTKPTPTAAIARVRAALDRDLTTLQNLATAPDTERNAALDKLARAAVAAVQETADIVVALTDDLATDVLGETVHAGLRKGTEEPNSHHAWKALALAGSGWGEAVEWAIGTLAQDGVFLGELEA